MFASLTALALSLPATAQDKARTKTFDGSNVTASLTTTQNKDEGTATHNRSVTNPNTGKTASSIDVVQTGLQGRSRSIEGERTRTDTGSTFIGTATGRGGEAFGLASSRSRDGQGNSAASQSVTIGAGETLAARSRTITRADGQVNRNVTRTQAEVFSRARGEQRSARMIASDASIASAREPACPDSVLCHRPCSHPRQPPRSWFL